MLQPRRQSTKRAAFVSPLLNYINNTYSYVSSEAAKRCNYSEGQWVWAPGHARQYNTTQWDVKESHDCIRNGRPDTGYLDWRWQPAGSSCALPAIDAGAFLSAMRALASSATPWRRTRRSPSSASSAPRSRAGSCSGTTRARAGSRSRSRTSAGTVSFVRATGKPEDESVPYNHVHLDQPGDRSGADADTIDVAVVAAGHWLLNGAIYYNVSEVIGAHNAPAEMNDTGTGYAWPLKMVYWTAVERLSSAAGDDCPRLRTLVLATFSPEHFGGSPIDRGLV